MPISIPQIGITPISRQSISRWTKTRRWRDALEHLYPLLKQLEQHNEIETLSHATLDFCTEVFRSPLSVSLPQENVKLFSEVQKEIYEKHLSPDVAERRARKELRERPTDSNTLVLANLLLRKGGVAEARTILGTLREGLDDPDNFILLAELATREKNIDAALADYQRACQLVEDRIRQQPKAAGPALQWRTTVERLLGLLAKSDQAEQRKSIIEQRLAFCDEILDGINESASTYYLWDSRAQIIASMTNAEMPAAERHSQVIKSYENAMAVAEEKAHMRKRIAWCYFDLQKFDEALEHLQRAVQLNPSDRSMLTWKGVNAITACPSDSFVAALLPLADRAVELSGKDVGVQVMQAQVLFAIARRSQNRNLPDTETYARQAFELSTELARMTNCPDASAQQDAVNYMKLSLDILLKVFREQGRTEEFQRHRDEAIELWRELMRLQPDDTNAPFSIVSLLVADNHWTEAVEELNFVCEQTQTVMPRYWRGLAQLALQDQVAYRETCADLLESFSTAPDEGGFALWTCVLAPGAVEDYGPLLQMARSLDEKGAANLTVETSIAAAYYRAGQNDEALQRLAKAAESADERSSPAYAFYFLAMAQHAAGQPEEARKHLDQANQLTEAILAEHQEHRSVPWNRRLTLELLRSEAESLLRSTDKKEGTP